MTLSNLWHILQRETARTEWRENYWLVSDAVRRLPRIMRPDNRHFRRVVLRSYLGPVPSRIRPIAGQTTERVRAAARWLALAQDATPDDGVSLAYGPVHDEAPNGWFASYPETTGYIMQSLFEYASVFSDADLRDRAMRMGVWEARVQMPNGAVQAGPVCPPDQQKAAVFNTGMVLQGYTAALMAGAGEPIASGAARAGAFLLEDLGADGHFRHHGPFVMEATIKTYNVLCGWALQRYGRITGDQRYHDAAVRSAEAAVREQRPNGWFANNGLGDDRPLTHTIGYTLQGILEIGVGAEREDLVRAARAGLDAVLPRVAGNGFLHGAFDGDWRPTCFSECLTGNAQIAIVAYRMFELTSERYYLDLANRLTNHLKAVQVVDSPESALTGALPGSWPVLGRYMPARYPNWATKYLLDALLLQHRLDPA
jgi:hypothetical protein